MAELMETRAQIAGRALAPVGHPVLRHHALARLEGHGPELLHVVLRDGKEVLPLFSSGETARDFLDSRDLGETWYARECYAGELVSMLLGLYTGLDGVLLDPVYGNSRDGYVPENFMYVESFIGYLLGEGSGASIRLAPQGLSCSGTP